MGIEELWQEAQIFEAEQAFLTSYEAAQSRLRIAMLSRNSTPWQLVQAFLRGI